MKTSLGHYEIVAELGRGGMGVVYKGYEPALARYVAIKELSPALAHDPSLVERFLREARSMAALNDPHIIQVYFIGQAEGQPFFAMEFVEGESLSQLIKREGRLPIADVLKILLQTARGLQTAHERGVIHRDIKPANLMLDLRGRVKIADFGIALARQEFDAKLTGTGEFVGTPGYLSPEVCLGRPVDARSDLFALGIVMFEALTGRLPFSDESPLKLMLDVVQADIPDIRALNREVDEDTARILARLVAKEPADRYASAALLAADLEKHPLLAGQGAQLALQVRKPVGAAATLYTAPATAPTAPRRPTPPPVVDSSANAGSPAVPAAGMPSAAGAAPAPAPAPPPPARKASKAPMRVAGMLALGVVGAAAFGAWRVFGPGVAGTDPAPAATAVATAPPTGGEGGGPAGAEGASPGPAGEGDPVASGSADAAASAALVAGAAASATAAASPSDAGNAPVATIEPAAAAPIESSAAAAAPVVAAPAPRSAAPRVPTTVAVVGSGDPAIIGPAVQAIEERAVAAGWQLVGNASRADRVIRVNFEQTGTQQLQYYGRSSEMVIGQLSVRAFGQGGAALGAGLRSRIEYTPMTADAKVQAALQGSQVEAVVGAPGR
ncbi:MAG: hypothetical protein KatS3mg128_1004 [Silanimonas sp.]|nr:MAG: hypothetical protein KatS3mg127_1781 [Silanimonas sp.]GIX39955.1 MAG: hypothetical protein KatS3mg128_1004 [Silanimonas sp.]